MRLILVGADHAPNVLEGAVQLFRNTVLLVAAVESGPSSKPRIDPVLENESGYLELLELTSPPPADLLGI